MCLATYILWIYVTRFVKAFVCLTKTETDPGFGFLLTLLVNFALFAVFQQNPLSPPPTQLQTVQFQVFSFN